MASPKPITESLQAPSPPDASIGIAFKVGPAQLNGLHIGDTIAFTAETHNTRIRFLKNTPFSTMVFDVEEKKTVELTVINEGSFRYVVEMLDSNQPLNRNLMRISPFTTPCIDIP